MKKKDRLSGRDVFEEVNHDIRIDGNQVLFQFFLISLSFFWNVLFSFSMTSINGTPWSAALFFAWRSNSSLISIVVLIYKNISLAA